MERVKLFFRKFSEAWTSCMLCMVQGDLSVLTIKHAVTASKTGILTGIAIVITSYLKRLDNKYMTAWLTGVLTIIADMIIHPPHYISEPILTGIGAGLLALTLSFILEKKN